ncbi:MAG: VanZ family protein [Bacteroidetes bacterium]|nr:VanZ family protein [Bacteroidota bacterium]MBL0016729.1 VanZ family protein [Bacteroidota bacterium]
MNPRFRMFLKTLPAIVWMGMIFSLSNQPGGGSGALSRLIMSYLAKFGIDFQAWFGEHAVWVLRKCAHFTEYMILFFLLMLAFSVRWERKTARWWALLGTFLYAASDEFHQLFIPGRVGDVFDVMIDTSGGLFGLVLISLWWWMRSSKKETGIQA